ncbi:MAG: hypothetical protein B7Y93_08670, partial [Micrococcales bacterium 32-70-13]
PEVSCVIVTSRLRPGLDGGYTVATMQRAALLAEAGLPVTLLTVDLHPDYGPFAAEFRRLGLADENTVMRNLLDEVRARPALLRDAADPGLAPTITPVSSTPDAPELDAHGHPWRRLVRGDDGGIVHTDFFDAEGAPLFRLPYLARPDWWRAPVVIDVLGPAGERLGGLAGFRGLYRAWVDAVVAELVAEHPERPIVAIAEARQVGELLIGTPALHLVHTVHNAHTLPPHAWNSPIDVTWRGWLDTLPGYDAVVWLTHEQRADVVRLRGAEEAPGWVIPHPARVPDDVARHPETVAGAAGREAHRAVMVARLAAQKRIDHAIRAWAQVVAEIPDARLDIYGDGALRAELQALIDEQGLAEHVTLHGHVAAAPEQTRTAACLLVTSVYEGQSLAIAEAMARGCPAVSYDIAYGPAEMIADGVSGLLVPPGDPAALAAAVVGLLRDEDRRDRFSRAALAWAESAGPERALAQWRELLATVTAQPPRSP